MIYFSDNYETAIPESSVLKIEKRQKEVTTQTGRKYMRDMFYIFLKDRDSAILCDYEPYERKILPLPDGIEIWLAFVEDDGVHWEQARASHGVHQVKVFSGQSSLEMVLTDANESSEFNTNNPTILVDRNTCRSRVNDFESLWSNDLIQTMESAVGRTLKVDDLLSLDLKSNDQLPRTKFA